MNPVRAVRFPLKLKLLALMIAMVATSLTIFVAIALKTFKEDKSAYIYETLLNKASSERLILSHKLDSLYRESPRGSFHVSRGRILYGPHDPAGFISDELSEASSFTAGLVVPEQNEFYRFEGGAAVRVSEAEREIFSSILGKSLHQGVKEVIIGGNKWLLAYDYGPDRHFIYTASLPQEKAFEATTFLIKRSTQYGLFILGAAMVISVLLARPLTSQLEELSRMTQEIANGNFSQRTDLPGQDEVGALSDSVNDMADKIVHYMDEMKEKARLENEVAVAQLVQASFFPGTMAEDPHLKVYGHYEPASECGGDWWGMFDHGEWRVFFIADATGHGVPAALLTATINCCKSSLSFILEARPALLSEPHEILRYMNQAVHAAGKEIQVTCFAASYNRRTHEFIYANSSHIPPLLFNSASGELSKDHLIPLIEVNGPRLGQHPESAFSSHRLILENHDTIFFYTDGVTEAEDPDGSHWGERRMIKSLIKNGGGTPEEMVKGLLGDLKSFTAGQPKSDDLTLVALKVIS